MMKSFVYCDSATFLETDTDFNFLVYKVVSAMTNASNWFDAVFHLTMIKKCITILCNFSVHNNTGRRKHVKILGIV